MHLAKRIVNVAPSATLAISNLSKEMVKKGQTVIDLSIGQPDFTTPQFIDEAASQAMASGVTSFYTSAAGLPALKNAISDFIAHQTGVRYTPKQIAVTTGAKFALYALFSVYLNPGDEVLLPVPYWVSYEEQIKLAGGVVRAVTPAQSSLKVTVDELDQMRTAKTRALVLNSPANPTGVVYSKEEMTLIGNWALQHDILVIADDIYRDLVYNDTKAASIIAIDPQITANTVLISGVSKSYAMTGWRIGYAAGPAKLISAMSTFLSHTTGNPATVSQYAAIAALASDQSSVETMRRAFEQRLNAIYPLVAKIPGFELAAKPQGAFYLFPQVKRAVALTHYATTDDFVAALLSEAGVAIVPGRAFGMPDHARISYAKDLPDLKQGIALISAFIDSKS